MGTPLIWVSKSVIKTGEIIVTHCRPDIQQQRLMDRDGIGKEEALRRIASQMPQEEKLSFADYAIDTSGSLRETVEQTERIFRQLMQDYYLKSASIYNT